MKTLANFPHERLNNDCLGLCIPGSFFFRLYFYRMCMGTLTEFMSMCPVNAVPGEVRR